MAASNGGLPILFEEGGAPSLRERLGFGSAVAQLGPPEAIALEQSQIDAARQILGHTPQHPRAFADAPELGDDGMGRLLGE